MRRFTETSKRRERRNRRGTIVVLAAVVLVLVAICLAFAIDVGYMCLVRTEAQTAADAAALAGGQVLVSEERLRGSYESMLSQARRVASDFAAQNRVGTKNGTLEGGHDIQIGRLQDRNNRSAPLDQRDPKHFNAISVTVRTTTDWRGQSPLFFAFALGKRGFDMHASATVAFTDRISGFKPRSEDPEGKTPLLPFTVRIADWQNLLDQGASDDFAYDETSKTVSSGQDGVPELKLFPVDHGAGNWGTVDIGNPNNSTAELERQIRFGINTDDLAFHGGSLQLDPTTRSLTLNGDTGISAGMKDALVTIVGQPRAIPLYQTVSGQGNQLDYEIVGFAGIRIVEVELTGGDKRLTVQPAYVIDSTAIPSPGCTSSYFVVRPPVLVR